MKYLIDANVCIQANDNLADACAYFKVPTMKTWLLSLLKVRFVRAK